MEALLNSSHEYRIKERSAIRNYYLQDTTDS